MQKFFSSTLATFLVLSQVQMTTVFANPATESSAIPTMKNVSFEPRDSALEISWDPISSEFLNQISNDLSSWKVRITIGPENENIDFPITENRVVVNKLDNGVKYQFNVKITDGIQSGPESSSLLATPFEPLINSFIVSYEAGVKPTQGGEATGGVLDDGTVLEVGKPLGDGMRTLTLDKSVSQADADQIAKELTQDSSIEWAMPDEIRYPTLMTKSLLSEDASKNSAASINLELENFPMLIVDDDREKPDVDLKTADEVKNPKQISKYVRPMASCVDSTYIVCDITQDSIYDTYWLSNAGLQETAMWVHASAKTKMYSHMQFDYWALSGYFLTWEGTDAGFMYDINDDGYADKAIFPTYRYLSYNTPVPANTYTWSDAGWVRVGGLGNCSATWERYNGGVDNDYYRASADWKCLFGSNVNSVRYMAYALDDYGYDEVVGSVQDFITPFITVPSVPRTVAAVDGFNSVSPRSAKVRISWTAPSTTGGTALTYNIYRKSGSSYELIADNISTLNYTVDELDAGSPIVLAVSAQNFLGESAKVNANAVTPKTLPVNVGSDSITVAPGNGSLTVGWTLLQTLTDFGGTTSVSYEALATGATGQQATCTSAISSCKIIGLTNGSDYQVSVRAKNSIGFGAADFFGNGAADNDGQTTPVADVPGVVRSPKALDGFITIDPEARVSLSWVAPASNGGATITGYRIWQSSNAGTTWSLVQEDLGRPVLGYLIGGLTAGSSYLFRVSAINSAGPGPSATTGVVKPTSIPIAVDASSIEVVPSNSALAINWTTLSQGVDSGGLPITYIATARPSVSPTSATTKSCTVVEKNTCVITGLVNARNYTIEVTSKNTRGTSVATSEITAAPIPVPGVVRSPKALDGFITTDPTKARVNLSWVAPASNGGATITGYRIWQSSNAGTTWSQIVADTGSINLNHVISAELTAGSSYLFRVSAINSAGPGPSATTGVVKPTSIPIAVDASSIEVVPSNSALAINWTTLSQGVDSGGLPITYIATARPSVSPTSATTKSCTVVEKNTCVITGLVNARNYTIEVTSKNTRGTSVATSEITAAPIPVPGVVRSPKALDGFITTDPTKARVNLSWVAPASNGGATITGYRIWQSSNAGTTWSQIVADTGSINLNHVISAENVGSDSITVSPGNGSLTVGWTLLQKLTDFSGTTSVSYEARATGATGATGPQATLTAGSSYLFRVSAINSAGPGPSATTGVVKPTSIPIAVDASSIEVVPSNSALAINWTTLSQGVDSGGLPITYIATARPSVSPTSATTKSCTVVEKNTCVITGLVNARNYTIEVTSKNTRGTSVATSEITAAPGVLPGIPRNVQATKISNGNLVTVSWLAPSSMGSGALIRYRASAYDVTTNGGEVAFCEATTLTCEISLTDPSDVLYYSVKTVTAVGSSPESSPRVSVVTVEGFEPNDTRYPEQWALQGEFGVKAEGAWLNTIGESDIVVGIIDTGMTTHPELDQNTVTGWDFISSASRARDGDGRDSNPNDTGDWDAFSSSSWHGTHVAGIVAAVGGNGAGITGIAPGVRLQHLRVLGLEGGMVSDIVSAITWGSGGNVSGIPANPTPSKVLNLSLGGDGSCSIAEQSAINSAILRGTTVVVAAGNEDMDSVFSSPGNCNGVITVAASNDEGQITGYSNYGATVEIMAPGGEAGVDAEILSTMNSGLTAPGSATFGAYQGTSMAAPLVAGIVALMLSVNPNLTPEEIRTIISQSALPGTQCPSPYLCGPGIIDAEAAVDSAR